MNPTRACIVLAALSLAACGQKGPLYLPDSTQGEVITRPTQTPTQTPAETPAETPAAPAPEATPPEATDPDKDKKKDGATPPK
jgi:predicted small lipoprotein YifL